MPTILHLGLGAFHRAHQAAYLQRLHRAGDTSWQLASGNIRPEADGFAEALRSQGGGYTLETIAPDGQHLYEWITAIAEVIPWDAQLSGIVARGSAPDTRIVSFTVTEAGYAAHPGNALYGALAAILGERMRQGAGPVTLLCCDNLRHNGDHARVGLLRHLEAEGRQALADWVRRHTTSPNTMVDRITPRPDAGVVERVRRATGRHDPAALMAESYIQWVVEDRFATGRPNWERAGVQLVDDVAPHEDAKIRLLNATHSCIAWAGALRGHRFIHEGVADTPIRRLAYDYATQAAIPVLTPSPVDLPAYRDKVLERFGNPAIADTTARVVSDSFAKIPAYVAPTVGDCLRLGAPMDAVAALPALYLAFLQRWLAGGIAFDYQDQALDADAARALCTAADPVLALASQPALWGDAAAHPRWVDGLRHAVQRVADDVLT